MPKRDIVVIGASSGGIEALTQLLGELPEDFAASLFVVCHISAQSPGVLPKIISRQSKLPAANAIDQEPIQPGRVYVAPPDHHLLLEKGFVRVTRGPKENRFRPAVDPLFRSAAYIYGPRVIGVVLTGSLDDGTAGLWAIKDRGGLAVVQDPNEAMFPDMPLSAISHVATDYRVPLAEMAPLLTRLVSEPVPEEGVAAMSDKLEIEVKFAAQEKPGQLNIQALGETSAFACPECHGVLWKIHEGGLLRFRCRTGHAYTAQVLLSDLSASVEAMLWSAIRGLEESAELSHYLANQLQEEGQEGDATRFLAQARQIEQRAQWARQALPDEGDPIDPKS